MKRNLVYTTLLLVGFIVSYFASKILYFFNPDWATYLPKNAFLWHTSWFVLRLLPVACIAALVSKKKILSDLGLNAKFLQPFLYALLFTMPLFVGLAIVGQVNSEFNFIKVFSNCIYPGIFEEILVRSFLIGLLFRRLKWGFIPASLLGALFFGAWHIYQGHDLLSSLFAFLVTGAGSIWFGWLYLEWRFNAWINICLHILMNFAWLLFSVEGGASGTIWANVFRILTVVISILLTIKIQSKKKGFIVNRKTLWSNA